MEFLRVVGGRRSIRWFAPDRDVEPEKVQRVLEAARLTGCPGNLQPWRAVVVRQGTLGTADRERLLAANNHQHGQQQAPVWIYWFGDPAAVAPGAFLAQISLGLEVGALASSAGWDTESARAAIEEGVPANEGMAPLHETVHPLPPELAPVLAAQETVGAITTALLAAVNEGLGTGLNILAAPPSAPDVVEVLGVPPRFAPVWLQLLGYPAEDPAGGGARPREPFEALFADGRWGTPLRRDPRVVESLAGEGLIQPEAPQPGRAEELDELSRRFGLAPGRTSTDGG